MVTLNDNTIQKHQINISLFDLGPFLQFPSGSYALPILTLIKDKVFSYKIPECTLTVTCEIVSGGALFIEMKGIDLDDLDTFDLSDPYFILTSNGNELYKSEVIYDNLNPVWKGFTLRDTEIRNGVVVNVWDKDVGSDDFIGGCEFTLEEFMRGKARTSIHNSKKKGNTKSGEIEVKVSKIPDILTRLYEIGQSGICYLIGCNLDYRQTGQVLDHLYGCFGSNQNLIIGFGSSEKASWLIDEVSCPPKLLHDPYLKNKRLGPNLISAAMSQALPRMNIEIPWIVCILLQRDITDVKTFQQIIKELDRNPLVFVAFIPNDAAFLNLESVADVVIVRYGENIAEDIQRKMMNVVVDLERKVI
ncbi:hypothetical protein SteCoe_27553 [Stentor coeruleus]|uniref:C2 domain-containing protein n=1 Tax=Stentor coeruleus TaxID=5963 RepID=A0A1R2BAB7_9CILI|nr:hypothetical protein SteCoe_27553 [Stentor coeruleus]